MLINTGTILAGNQEFTGDSPYALSATAAAGTGVTLTIPAAGVGIYLFLTSLTIQKFAAAALSAAATPVIVTTTGINNTPSINFDAAADAQGTLINWTLPQATPIRGSATNTAITIVCPATTSVVWNVIATWQQATI